MIGKSKVPHLAMKAQDTMVHNQSTVDCEVEAMFADFERLCTSTD
jgi:hypothetical protein